MTEAPALQTTPYEILGGAAGVRRLAERFYTRMAETPEAATIRNMHEKDLSPIIEKLAGYLSGWLGGPRDYFERPDAPCIMSVHHKLAIGAAERDQWLLCMDGALQDVGATQEIRTLLNNAFHRMADAMRSS